MKKAVAYVSDIILGRTGEVIKRACQVELIVQYAVDNNIEIIGWFEDEIYDEDVLMRPGIQALLACDRPFDVVICERVWALSRSMAVLEPLFKEFDRRGLKLEAATTMWDCVSQKCRRRFRGSQVKPRAPEPPPAMPEEPVPLQVKRPARLHFKNLVK